MLAVIALTILLDILIIIVIATNFRQVEKVKKENENDPKYQVERERLQVGELALESVSVLIRTVLYFYFFIVARKWANTQENNDADKDDEEEVRSGNKEE